MRGRLPEAGQPRARSKAAVLPRLVPRDLPRQGGSRSDHAHVTEQYVDELGQLVETVLPKESADRRHARIALHLEDGTARFVAELERWLEPLGMNDHRAELQHRKDLAMKPDALL